MTEHLFRVEAPHFVAGFIAERGVCIRAAPILKWTVGKRLDDVMRYVVRRGWRWRAWTE